MYLNSTSNIIIFCNMEFQYFFPEILQLDAVRHFKLIQKEINENELVEQHEHNFRKMKN